MQDSKWARKPPPRLTRVLAGLGGTSLFFLGIIMFLLAGVMSQTGWDTSNSLQAAIGAMAAVGLFGAAGYAFAYAAEGEGAKPLGVVLILAVALVGVWLLGLATWCSSCGGP